jgi:hypothetical protein
LLIRDFRFFPDNQKSQVKNQQSTIAARVP